MTSVWNPLPGHIIRVNVQYSDSERHKSRFPVVVSCSEFNANHPDIIVAFTTSSSNIKYSQSYDVEISDKHKNFSVTGLTHSTTVRCGRLWSVNKRNINDYIGVVPDDLLIDIQKLVLKCFNYV